MEARDPDTDEAMIETLLRQPPQWASSLTLPYDAGIPLLDRLFADATRYVTGSVANHVNDVSKKDPHLALDTLDRWRVSGHHRPRDGLCDRPCRRTLVRADRSRTLSGQFIYRRRATGGAEHMTRRGGAVCRPLGHGC
jgi:hypothetical protein